MCCMRFKMHFLLSKAVLSSFHEKLNVNIILHIVIVVIIARNARGHQCKGLREKTPLFTFHLSLTIKTVATAVTKTVW